MPSSELSLQPTPVYPWICARGVVDNSLISYNPQPLTVPSIHNKKP